MSPTICDWLIEVGTIGTCIATIILSQIDSFRRVSCVFVWTEAENYIPTLYLSNASKRLVAIKEIKVIYNNHEIGCIHPLNDPKLKSFAIIKPMESKEMILYGDHFAPVGKINDDRKRKLIIKTVSTTGRKSRTTEYYSSSEIYTLLIGKAFEE